MDVAIDGLADGVQAAPVLDGSLRTQDQGSVSDSDAKYWDAGSDCDAAPVSDCDTDEAQKLLHMAVAMAEALEDEHHRCSELIPLACILWDGFPLAAVARSRMRK